MNWLTKIFKRDDHENRLAAAHEQRADAARLLHETREVVQRRREREAHNHITEGFALAFERERRGHA